MVTSGRISVIAWITLTAALPAGAAIEGLDFSREARYEPGGPSAGISLVGTPKIWRLTGGGTVPGGGGTQKAGLAAPDRVERVDGGFRFTLKPPDDGIVFSFIYRHEGTWMAGKIVTDAAPVLTAKAGSPAAELVVQGRVAPPDREFPAQAVTNRHRPATAPGSAVRVRATVTLRSGTWTAAQFAGPFGYTLAGSVEFPPSAAAPPEPAPAAPVPVLFPGPQAKAREGDGTIEYELFLAQPLDREVAVELNATGSASPGKDYVLARNRIVFPAGATNAALRLTLPADEEYEPTETLELSFAASTPAVRSGQCMVIHIEDLQRDSDGDGLPDGWETRHSRSPAAARPDADEDGDGWTNLQEFRRGSDPKVRQVPDRANRLGLEVWTPLDAASTPAPGPAPDDLPPETALRADAENQPDQKERVLEYVRDPKTGWVTAVKLCGRVVQSRTHRANGEVASSTDADGVTTRFEFNEGGEVAGLAFSDGTPPLAIGRTRMGQIESLRTAGAEMACVYEILGRTLVRYSGSNVLNHAFAYGYTNAHMEIIRRVLTVGDRTNRVDLQYGPGAILEAIRDPDLTVTYKYRDGPMLENTVLARRDGTPLLSLRQTWDTFAEYETGRAWSGSKGLFASLRIERDSATMRLARAQWSDGANWECGYDARGRLSHATFRTTPDGAASPLRRFGYAWNQRGDLFLAGPAHFGKIVGNAFEANQLNLLIRREWEGRSAVIGRVRGAADAAVSVNDLPCERNGEWFRCLLPVDNRSGAATVPVTVRAVKGEVTAERTGFITVPAADERPLYSRAGALLKDSRYRYRYDAHGNLLAAEPVGGGTAVRVAFGYYPDGLRASKTVYAAVGGQWQPVRRHRYAYDRCCLVYEEIAERAREGATIWSREYLWGLDLADQQEGTWRYGSQGVGGLVAVKIRRGAACRILAPLCDPAGNITKLFDTELQKVVAEYTFTPFGEMAGLWTADPSLADFPFRFQSQYYDTETGLYCFGSRYYDPRVAKWLTSARDLWEKQPGANVTGFSGGSPL